MVDLALTLSIARDIVLLIIVIHGESEEAYVPYG